MMPQRIVLEIRNRLALAYDRIPEGTLTHHRRSIPVRWRCTMGRATSWIYNTQLLVFLPWHTSNSGEGRALLVVLHVLE